jgi:hypothetical protein
MVENDYQRLCRLIKVEYQYQKLNEPTILLRFLYVFMKICVQRGCDGRC